MVGGPVVFPMGNWSQGLIANDIGGSFSSWTKMSGNVQSAFIQHISGDGNLSWAGGVELSTNSSSFRMSPCLAVSEDYQELMAVWNQSNSSQSQRGVYAQRLDEYGNRLWGFSGTAVVPLNSNYDYLDISVAGFGDDIITTYIQQSVNMSGDIYASYLNADGEHEWLEPVTLTTSGNAKSDMSTGKGQECLFIVWTENGNIYAHSLREDGSLGAPDSYILGDINNDGIINVLDVVIIVNIVLSNEYNELADLNDDSIINVLDIVQLVNIILN